jgi:Beta-L-arabinofuranosidase, GH127
VPRPRLGCMGADGPVVCAMPVQQKDALETQETCTQYNILKIARKLFKWTGEAQFADFYGAPVCLSVCPCICSPACLCV